MRHPSFTALHIVLPIWIVWQTAALIKSCYAEEIIDYATPEHMYECESPCDDSSFCGRDLQCHTFSCENWYTLGHPTMTGYTPGRSPMLDCEILENGQDRSFLTKSHYCFDRDLPAAVTFVDGCQYHTSCSSYDSSPRPVAHMNRKCTSAPSDGFGFVCYDMAPDTDLETYFDDYIAATTDLDPVPCDTDDEINAENHVYTANLRSPRVVTGNGFSSSEFNATLASMSVVAEVFEVDLNEYSMFPLCDEGSKDTEFCGQDGTCHEFNCINVYDYGRKTVTGHDYQDISAPKLECSSEPPNVDDSNPCLGMNPDAFDAELISTVESPWPVLIEYYCSKGGSFNYGQSTECGYAYLNGRYATFNRHCSAQPNPYQNFSCYDMDPNTDMERYLEDYVNRTMLDSECTIDNLPYPPNNEPSSMTENVTITYLAQHSYRTCIHEFLQIGSSNTNCALVYGAVNLDDSDLTPIDFERLRHVMTSSILGNLPEDNETVATSLAATNNILRTCVVAVFLLIGCTAIH